MQALADAIRRNANGRLEAARGLAAELDRHAVELGLTDNSERRATSRALTPLLGSLAATTDDTQTVRVLAGADLRKENAFFYAHLDSAERLTTALREVNWPVLEDFAVAGDDVDQALIISALRQAAERDEHEVALARPLRKASDEAIALLRERARKPVPAPVPAPTPPPVPDSAIDVSTVTVTDVQEGGLDQGSVSLSPPPGNRVRARDVPAFVNKICDEAEDHPDAEFEISWRIVEP